jgi:hypothetical protein
VCFLIHYTHVAGGSSEMLYIREETMCCIYIPSVHQRGDNVLYLYTVRTSESRQCDVSIYRPYIREETMCCIFIPSVHQRGDNVMYLYTVRTSERRQCDVSIYRPYIREETMCCIYIPPEGFLELVREDGVHSVRLSIC